MPVILQSTVPALREDSSGHQKLLETFENYLNVKGLNNKCAVNAMPIGVGPDGDGITLCWQDSYWVVADTCRGRKLNPSIFSSLNDAIDFVKLKLN